MDNPASLVRRAIMNRQSKISQPAPLPLRDADQRANPQRHISSHASYTALMRSHDRISTRHIARGSGA